MSQSQLISMKATATLLAIALFTGATGYLCALFLLPVFRFLTERLNQMIFEGRNGWAGGLSSQKQNLRNPFSV